MSEPKVTVLLNETGMICVLSLARLLVDGGELPGLCVGTSVCAVAPLVISLHAGGPLVSMTTPPVAGSVRALLALIGMRVPHGQLDLLLSG